MDGVRVGSRHSRQQGADRRRRVGVEQMASGKETARDIAHPEPSARPCPYPIPAGPGPPEASGDLFAAGAPPGVREESPPRREGEAVQNRVGLSGRPGPARPASRRGWAECGLSPARRGSCTTGHRASPKRAPPGESVLLRRFSRVTRMSSECPSGGHGVLRRRVCRIQTKALRLCAWSRSGGRS